MARRAKILKIRHMQRSNYLKTVTIQSDLTFGIHTDIYSGMKQQILGLLREKKVDISGEELSAGSGISRAAVWKHIKKLQELGYNIEAGSKGYRLISSPDALFPWEFSENENLIHYFNELPSTMDKARELAIKGCEEYTIVISETQSKGRGRLKRAWISNEGGLYFTIILRPEIYTGLSNKVAFIVSRVLCQLLCEKYDIQATLKWPNDILVDDSKLAGILSEMEVASDMVSYINIGIGLNVNNMPDPEEQKAISLKKLVGKQIQRKEILESFIIRLKNEMKSPDYDNAVMRWKQYTTTIGKNVKITTINEKYEGLAKDVDENGALILELSDGTIKKVIFGDCFY